VYKELLSDKTKIVAFSHVSNALGVVNPVQTIIEEAKKVNALTLVDGAQAIQHLKVDVQALDCDFYVFSGHKVYAPTGIGILYGKEAVLNDMSPYQGGGDMIKTVTFEKTTYNGLPHKFEAGTPNISAGIALGTAFEFLNSLDLAELLKHEHELLEYATEEIKKIDGVKIYGDGACKTSVLSFLVDEIHPYDVVTLLDKLGVAVRTGHHCAQPIMNYYNIPGTVRMSIAMYNTKEDIDIFISSLKRALNMLR
jgi:cysteine desulfurase/selenocysteine lyase